MTETERGNKKVIARVIDEVMNEGSLELVDELFSEDLVEHDPHQAGAGTPRQAFVDAVMQFRAAFPDNRMFIDDQVAEGDQVATRWHMTGTHLGEFMGQAPSGRAIEVTGMFFDRLEDGRIVETWANYDLLGLLRQIDGQG
jgi:steroid delta-isomerase-like uncharacterized protein